MKAIHLFVATCVPNPIPVIRGRISCLLGEGECCYRLTDVRQALCGKSMCVCVCVCVHWKVYIYGW